MDTSECLTDQQVAQLLEGGERPAHLDAHLDRCEACFALLAEAAREDACAVEDLVAGRYRLLDTLGQGGMGRVLRAHDTVLDREVALKILRSEAFGAEGLENARARLREEARCMAGISHPNIVHVYDVGETDGTVYIAMEYVRGASVQSWIDGDAPEPTAVVLAFAGAARGLAAAHAHAVIHRDVKPSNMLVDDTGSIRVSDFGLARSSGASDQERGFGRSGTPGFMAPEQTAGDALCEATDQYGLARSLVAVLTRGRSTGAAEGLDHLDRRVAGVLRIALAGDPRARHVSMTAFAEALERAVRPRRGRWVAAGLLGAGLLGALVSAPEPDPCATMGSAIDEHWNEAVARSIRGALSQHTIGRDPTFAASVERTLNTHARDWTEYAPALCRKHAQHPAVTRCLHEKLAAYAVVVETLSAPTDADLQAVPRTLSTWSLHACRDRADDGAPPLPRADVERLARAEVLTDLGRLDAATALLDAPSSIDLAPSVRPAYGLRLALGKATIAAADDRVDDARGFFFAALLDALRIGSVAGQVDARIGLASMALRSGGDTHSARAELDQVTALLERVPDEQRNEEAALAWVDVHELDNDPQRALDTLDATASNSLAHRAARPGLLLVLGRYSEAVVAAQGLTDALEAELGPRHPRVGDAKAQWAAALTHSGRFDEAVRIAREAVAIYDAASESPLHGSGWSLDVLGMALWRRGDDDEAKEAFERALSILPKRDPSYGIVLDNLGTLRLRAGDASGAEQAHRAAVETLRATHGEDHHEVGLAHANLGEALYQQGRFDEAERAFVDGHRMLERALGPEHPDNASLLFGIGKCRMKRERFDDALAPLHRATVLREAVPDAHDFLGIVRYAEAIAVERATGDIPRARALVRAAVADLEAAHRLPDDLARARAWLEAHPP
ncbi:MAG: protein kinase domain-containing protein [Nannocystaceae bacterium]|nr:serine/threonine-protein kinase [bacterium]